MSAIDLVRRERELDVIKVNVGGKIFMTTLRTLTQPIPVGGHYIRKVHGHLLQDIFESLQYDQNNLIFIDRNPKYFGYVLDFLRTIDLDVDAFLFSLTDDVKKMNLIAKEFEFYKVINTKI